MASQKNELRIPWPFAPSRTDLNQATSLIKIVAMLTMLCDHSGKMLFPQYPVMRMIGRLAFPIYAYCIAAGCVYTRDHLKYLKRIVLTALISQPLYAVGMAHTNAAMFAVPFSENPVKAALVFYLESWRTPSILATLAFGVAILWALRNRQIVLLGGLFILTWRIQSNLDYGIRGIGLIVLFYVFIQKWWVSLPIVAAYMIWWGLRGSAYALSGFGVTITYGLQMFAIFALPFIYIHMHTKVRLNKWVAYLFYPGHLVLIMLLDRFVFV